MYTSVKFTTFLLQYFVDIYGKIIFVEHAEVILLFLLNQFFCCFHLGCLANHCSVCGVIVYFGKTVLLRASFWSSIF